VRLAAVAALVIALSGCGFVQKHPAVAAGIFGGSIGFTACAIDSAKIPTCAIIGGSAAVFLGGIMTLVTLFADTQDHSLPPEEPEEPAIVRVRKAATVFVDAGVEVVGDAGVAVVGDAGVAVVGDAATVDAVISPPHD
jgi:hypothetical protein